MRHFYIDTDPGADDAVALVMALRHPDIQVEGIGVVGGNANVDQAVQNALYVVELCDARVPVYRGMGKPLFRDLITGSHVHGVDGLGDIGLPLSGRAPASGHAVRKMLDTIDRFRGDITLVTLGPLTNIAAAIFNDPSIAEKISECIVMGGTGEGLGNVTPVAEYNIWVDPEAAKIVFESGMSIKMVGWDISVKFANVNKSEAEELRNVGTPLAEFCVDIHKDASEIAPKNPLLEAINLPDPIAMAVALDPTVATRTEKLFVQVETSSELCRGQTVVDHLEVTGNAPNVEVVREASHEAFIRMLHAAVQPVS